MERKQECIDYKIQFAHMQQYVYLIGKFCRTKHCFQMQNNDKLTTFALIQSIPFPICQFVVYI